MIGHRKHTHPGVLYLIKEALNHLGLIMQHLVWGKGVAIDISIQMAYIKAIRCAQHFIYIENQYFIGSSYNWPDYINAGISPKSFVA